jgi:hypothetical protein
MQIKYGVQVLRPDVCVVLIVPPPPTLWERVKHQAMWHWHFLCDFFWPSFWLAVAVTLLRHGG